jgi:CrcB protein
MKTVLFDCILIGTGGFAGAICRYGVAAASRHLWETSFPIGTLIANVIGCFLVGVLIGSGQEEANRNLKLLFGVGFLGALTTFSTFGAETVSHANEQSYSIAMVNIVMNVVIGLAAVMAGLWLGKKMSA